MTQTASRTLQAVLDAIKELTATTGMAPRQAIIESTGLSPHIIKERIDELIESGNVVRRERGVYQYVEVFAPARPVSRTVIHGGMTIIEVGDITLKLTPVEEGMLRSMYAGAVHTPSPTQHLVEPKSAKVNLTADEVAEMLGCSRFQVESKAREGVLPGLKFGDGGWVFPHDALVRAINKRAEEEAAARAEPPKAAKVATTRAHQPQKKRRTLPVLD